MAKSLNRVVKYYARSVIHTLIESLYFCAGVCFSVLFSFLLVGPTLVRIRLTSLRT